MPGPTKSHIALSLGSQDVHGTPASLDALKAVLSTIPRPQAVSLLCFIGSHWPGDTPPQWIELEKRAFSTSLLSPRTREAVEAAERREGMLCVVFTRSRSLTLLRLAFAICPDADFSRPDIGATHRHAMGEAFLLVGSLLDEKSPGQITDPLGLIVPAFEESNPPSLLLSLARSYAMASDPAWGNTPLLQEANRRFIAEHGLGLRDYMYVVAALVTKLMTRGGEPGHGLLKLTEAFTRARDRDAIRRVLASLSTPYGALAATVGGDLSAILRSHSQEPFRSKPLIAFSHDDIFACADFQALAEQLTSGLFWKVRGLFSNAEADQVFAAWGKLFESPVSAALETAIDETRWDTPAPRLIRSPKDEDGNELTDALITCGPHVVVIEVKAFVLTEKAKYSGDSARLLDEAKRKLLKESKNGLQLARALERLFGSSSLRERLLGRHEIRAVYPVVVCMDRAIVAPGIAPLLDTVLRAEFARFSSQTRAKIKSLTILNADDVDSLAAVIRAGRKPHALLAHRFETDPSGGNTFHNYLFDAMTRLGLEKPGKPEQFDALFDDTKTYWLSQGNPEVFVQ